MRPMLILGLAVALLAGVAPLLSIYGQHIFVLVALYGAVALAWNILGGMAGQMSLGHALFVGAGAYVSTALYLNLGVSPWIGLVAAADNRRVDQPKGSSEIDTSICLRL